jgi:hypothetical protein
VIHNPDGTVISNMIGALTSMILEHWCGSETEIADKNEVILMNLKCHKMSQYDDFHRDWMQRIYEVKDSKNLLWKQVYLAALPSKFVDYIRMQEVFQLPFESYTWGEIYSLITKTLVSLCTSSKVNKSLEKLSRLPDRKSICSKYGLTLDDPLVKKRKAKKRAKREFKETFYKNRRNYPKPKKRYSKSRQGQASGTKRGYYKYVPKTHYYNPSDIHLHTHKQEME